MSTKLEHIFDQSRNQLALISMTALVLTYMCYGPVLLKPGDHMFGNGNDAVKNYYALAWFVEHEEGLSFGGMKYPHEGYYLQTDGHAPLGILLRFLGASGSQAVALINWLMVISIPLSIVLFFLVFRRLKIHWLGAFIASLSLIALSPQIDRLESHFALSYMFFFPLIFLLLLNLSRRRPWVSFLAISTVLSVAYFLHPYLGVMLSFIVLGFIPFFLFQMRLPNLKYAALVSFLSAILPLVLWKVVVNLTDPVLNRTSDPWGFAELVTRWKTLLMPRHDWPGIIPTEQFPMAYWEGMCYIGVGGYVLALGLIALIPRLSWNRHLLIRVGLLALPCLAALVLAFGYPFSQFPEIVEQLPFLQQFRALGRLSWIFYYLAIGGMFYALLKYKGNFAPLFKSIAGVAAFFFLLEGAYIHHRMGKVITENENLFSSELRTDFLQSYPISTFKDIDAIVPAPMYYVGSDTYGTQTPVAFLRECLKLSFYTGIPTTANSTSREPVTTSIESIQLTAPDYYEKVILDKMDPSKPNLGVVTKELLYDAMERTCCGELGQALMPVGDWHLYEQAKSDFSGKSIVLDTTLSMVLHAAADTLIQTTDFEVHQIEFETPGLQTKSAFNSITTIQDSKFLGKTLNFSCWIFNPLLESHPGTILMQKLNKDNTQEWLVRRALTDSNIQSGDSTRFDFDFTYPESDEVIEFLFLSVKHPPHSMSINHVLIREKETNVYRKSAKGVSKNNHLYMKHIDHTLVSH